MNGWHRVNVFDVFIIAFYKCFNIVQILTMTEKYVTRSRISTIIFIVEKLSLSSLLTFVEESQCCLQQFTLVNNINILLFTNKKIQSRHFVVNYLKYKHQQQQHGQNTFLLN